MSDVETEQYGASYGPRTDDRSLADLLRDLTSDSATLIRQESELLRREMDHRVKRLQREMTLLGAGGLVALLGAMALTAALILLIDVAIWAWLAALIVGALYVIAGGALLLVGRNKLREEEITPKETISSVKNDIRTMKEAWR